MNLGASGELFLELGIGLLPALVFLGLLLLLDAYRLLSLRRIVMTLVAGYLSALVALALGRVLGATSGYDAVAGPLIAESLKAVVMIYLVRSHRVGFPIDTAVLGFAVGTGYMVATSTFGLGQGGGGGGGAGDWLLAGLGGALLHGTATALFALVFKAIQDRDTLPMGAAFVPGLLAAWGLHLAYLHTPVDPLLRAFVLLLVVSAGMPLLLRRSETSLRSWLHDRFDVEAEILEMIDTGVAAESPLGQYFEAVRERVEPTVAADMLCYLRIHLELSISAKGRLLLRDQGFKPQPPVDLEERFEELSALEKTIGPTGRRALAPLLHRSRRDLWQIHMLEDA